MMLLTKIFHFDMAHVLKDYDGPCRNIHGHSYELRVTVKGEPINDPQSPKNGMVMDLHDLKCLVNEQIVNRLDHAFVLSSAMPTDFLEIVQRDFEKVVVVDYQPTSENLILDMVHRLQKVLPQQVTLHKIMLQETPGSYVEWVNE
ncbi:MAG: 6-carboxytetrahydropterin synthase [Bacteroidales bacterium]|nr:6-carboxytetrahydropterin synthase [Bacteroidales bacterium]